MITKTETRKEKTKQRIDKSYTLSRALRNRRKYN